MLNWKEEHYYYDGAITAHVFEDPDYLLSIAKYDYEVIWEYHILNKRNNWNRPERIDINFSSAKKMIITPDLENLAKEKKIVLGNPLKSDYSKITFTSISQEAGLFGEIPSGKIQSNSILIRCTQGADTLFIYKSPDNNWNYVNITYS